MEFLHLLPCQPLQDVLVALHALRERYSLFKSNEDELNSLLRIYPSLQEHISSVEKRCRQHRFHFSSESEHLFRSYTDKLRSTFVSDFEEISRLNQTGRKWKNRMRRFFRAEDISEKLASLTENAKEAKQLILELSTLLASAEVLEAHSKEIREHVSAEGQKQVRELRQHLIAHSNKALDEEFRPASCGEAVSANPTNLAFDMTSCDEKGEPNTFEGKLKALILDSSSNSYCTVTGVVGGGGTGKSCAVRELARDEDILKLFNGGVYEMKLGSDSSVKTVIKEVCKIVKYAGGRELAKELQKEKEVIDVISGASSWFRQHACLFIIDDVWDTRDVTAGMITQISRLASNRRSQVIFTSRNLNLTYGAAHNTVEFHAREPLSSQARAMLMSTARMDQNDPRCAKAGDNITKILSLCGGLPIALAIAGRFASVISRTHQDPWRRLNARLNSRVTPLLLERSDAYGTLEKMIDEATSFLESEGEKDKPLDATTQYGTMLRSLCVLQKQEFAPLSMLRRLWKLKDEEDARIVMESFRDVGIVKDETKRFGDFEVEGLTIHDLVNDYCIAKARKADMKESHHRDLLDGYINVKDTSIEEFMNKRRTASRRWWILANTADRHFCDQVVRHLIEGDMVEEAVELIFDPRWTVTVLKTSERLQLEVDHERLLEFLTVRTPLAANKKIEALKLLGSAVRLSTGYVADNPHEVWFQLHGRLVGWSNSSPEIADYVRRIEEFAERPWLKSNEGCLIPAGGQQAEVIHHTSGVNQVYLTCDGDIGACGIVRSEKDLERVWVSRRARLDRRPFVSELTLEETDVSPNLRRKPSTLASSRTFPVCVYTSPVGNPSVLIVGYSCGKLQLWNIETGKQIGQDLGGHADSVTCLAMSTERSMFVTGSRDKTVRQWSLREGKHIGKPFQGHELGVTCIAISKDGKRVVSGSWDKSIRLWNVTNHEPLSLVLLGHQKGITCIALSRTGRTIVSGSGDKTAFRWNAETGERIGEALIGHSKGLACIALSNDEKVVVSGSWDKSIRVWDAESGKQIGDALRGHEKGVRCITISSDGRQVVSGSSDRTVRVWNLQNKQLLGDTIQSRKSGVTCVAMSHDGSIAVSGSVSSTIKVWDVMSGKQLGETLRGHRKGVKCVAISNDSRIVLSGSGDNTVRLWSVLNGEPIGEAFRGHEKGVTCVAMSEDGKRVVSGSRDKSVRVWNVETGKQVGNAFIGHQKGVTCACFSSCGNMIASGSRDQTVRIWNVEKGVQVCEVWEFGDTPNNVYFRSPLDEKHGKLVHASAQTCEAEERVFDYEAETEVVRKMPSHLLSSKSNSNISKDSLMVSEDGLSIVFGKGRVHLATLERSIDRNQWVYSSQHKTLLTFSPEARCFHVVE